ncbi:hypothetical protein [Terasakiella sp. SH-1]|uniref:hypothetical protein n=1 Tax=Terasakiella sp. SH-1 TaxID=2560057 RepID=UPI001073BF7F|nr:hypothetical protein [Terasakiella sp. SH-1]
MPFLALVFALLLLPASLQAKERLIWFIWDLPPEFVKSGPWANQGYGDKFLKYFIDHMPQYDHKVQRVNIPRWSSEALRPNRCSAHIWGGFFPDQLIESKPYSFTPPHVLIAPKRHQERLGPPGSTVSLGQILAKGEMRLIAQKVNFNESAKQSRYPVLFPFLKPYMGKKNLVELSGGRNDVDLRLLEHGRGDITIGYPTTITTQQRVFNLGDNFVSYNLREHYFYKKVYVACNNTPFGQKVIAQINQLLTPQTLKTFLAYHEEWNDGAPHFRKTYLDYFIHGKELGRVID